VPFRSLRSEKRGARRDPREVPLRTADLAPSVSQRFDDFIARCLELDPTRRYATAGEALANLERSMNP
jgi:hypothetical protein